MGAGHDTLYAHFRTHVFYGQPLWRAHPCLCPSTHAEVRVSVGECPGAFLLSYRYFAVPPAPFFLLHVCQEGLQCPRWDCWSWQSHRGHRSVGSSAAGMCLMVKRINLILSVPKAVLLSQQNPLPSFQSALTLTSVD